jgi:signal transduction histidine kinase
MGELTKRLAEKTAELFCADQTLIGLAHDNQIVMKEVYEAETFHPAEFALKPGEGIAGWVMSHLRPYRSQDAVAPSVSAEFAGRFDPRGVMAVPILNHQLHVLGVMEFHRARENALFDENDLHLAETVALIAAAGIERAKLLGSIHQWTSSFQNILSFSTVLNESLHPETLIHRLVEHAAGFLGADAGLAGLVGEQTLQARGYWFRGQWHDFQAEWARDAGLPGWVFSNQWPYFTNEYPAHELAYPPFIEQFGVKTALCVPIIAAGEEVLGFVELHNKQDGREPFTWSDVSFMESLANSTAVAIRNARLMQELEAQRAQLQALSAQQITLLEEERRRIARELHDETGQALVGIKLGLQVLAHKIPPEIPGLREEVDLLRQQLNHSTTQLKSIAQALRPPILDELGLEIALNQCVNDFRKRTNLQTHFETFDLGTRLPQEAETVCYRIVQEALTNVARHAQARQVWIALATQPNFVQLSIRDDGQGFDPHRPPAPGLGLVGMQERAKMVGGELLIESAPGAGTVLTIVIPTQAGSHA